MYEREEMKKEFTVNNCALIYDSNYHIFGEKGLLESLSINNGQKGNKVNYKRFINEIRIHISNKCELSCEYCYLHEMNWHNKELSYADLEKICEYIENDESIENACTISFLGAEPLDEFEKIKFVVERLKRGKRKYFFALSTNGYALTQYKIEYLKDNDFNVVVSLDGDKDIQNYYRKTKDNKPTYEVIINNIRIMKEMGLKFGLQSVITKDADNLVKIAEHHNSLGAHNIKFYYEVSKSQWNRSQISSVICEVKKLWDYFRTNCLSGKIINLNHNISMIQRIYSGEKRFYHCGIGKNTIYIGNDLKVYPCNMVAYNNEILLDIDKDKKERELKNEQYYEMHVDNNTKCVNCWAKYFCGGRCSANDANICEVVRFDIMQAIYTYILLYNEVPDVLKKLLKGRNRVKTQGYIKEIANDLNYDI